MTLVVITVTTITCDGSATVPCPDDAVVVHEFPQSVAIRLARKQGWLIGADFLCPACSPVESFAFPDTPRPVAVLAAEPIAYEAPMMARLERTIELQPVTILSRMRQRAAMGRSSAMQVAC